MNSIEPKPTQTDAVDNGLYEVTGQPDPALSVTMYDPEENPVRIPVIEEQLQVSTQTVETGRVRLVKTVRQQEQVVDIPLMREDIQIERVPMDQWVDEAPPIRQEGDTTIYAVLTEEVVVQKRLRVIEEIRVTRRQVKTIDNQTVALRREEVSIDRLPAGTPNERPDLSGPGGEPLDGLGKSSL